MQRPRSSFTWPRVLASFRHPGYRVFLPGQALALLGTWVQGTAQRWLVLELTGDPFYVGLLGAVAGLPLLFFSLAGGILADRIPKVSFLIAIQTLIMIQAIIFGVLIDYNLISLGAILGLALVLGIGMAFEVPARQSLVYDLVGKEDITNGIAMHSMAFNLARFGGPAIAGLLMQAGMMAECFYFKALSAIGIIWCLYYVKRRFPQFNRPLRQAAEASPLSDIRELASFIMEKRLLFLILLNIMGFGILLLPYSILLPSLGRDVLGLNAKYYGLMCAANGLGALIGAGFVAQFGHTGNRMKWWRLGAILFPLSLMGVAFSRSFWDACLLLLLSGFVMVICSTSAISLLQIHSSNELRGRIMGLFTTSFMGLFPFGSLIQGKLASAFGIRETLFGCALVALGLSLSLWGWGGNLLWSKKGHGSGCD
ncbi:MAG: MFS transporter [Thermodesulfobacteria bacterium]|nr:MFS transporter [Thermodesulfobacteriota bacterium]